MNPLTPDRADLLGDPVGAQFESVDSLRRHANGKNVALGHARSVDQSGDPPPKGDRFGALRADEFDDKEFNNVDLIDGCFVELQPAVIAAPTKCLKTGIALDASLSLALARPFLGRFEVRKRRRVLVVSGESGGATLQETCRRIVASKEAKMREASDFWHISEYIPDLTHSRDLEALADVMNDLKTEVLILDPLYLMLPGDNQANMFANGERLRAIARMCSDAAVSLIAVHHATKNVVAGAPLKLAELAHAGYAQFFRQFCLLNRRTPYRFDGVHKLWVSFSGSAGHSSRWGVDVVEGVRHEGVKRTWQPKVFSFEEVQHRDRHKGRASSKGGKTQLIGKHAEKIREALGQFPSGETETRVREAAGLSGKCFAPALDQLKSQNAIQEVEVVKHGRNYTGIKLTDGDNADGDQDTAGLGSGTEVSQ